MNKTHRQGFGWPHIFFVLVLGIVLFGISTPLVLRESKAGARTEALNNAKAIAGGLVVFKSDRGAYPCAHTRKQLEEKGIHRLTKRDDANAYLAQLIVSDIIDDEGVFYALKTGAIKGNNNIKTAKDILSKGENAFAYVMALNQQPLTDVSSLTPLIIAPIKQGDAKAPLFDPNPYAGKYVYGAVDGSGKIGDITPTGQALSKSHSHLLESGTPDSLFGSDTPIIKYPLGL